MTDRKREGGHLSQEEREKLDEMVDRAADTMKRVSEQFGAAGLAAFEKMRELAAVSAQSLRTMDEDPGDPAPPPPEPTAPAEEREPRADEHEGRAIGLQDVWESVEALRGQVQALDDKVEEIRKTLARG